MYFMHFSAYFYGDTSLDLASPVLRKCISQLFLDFALLFYRNESSNLTYLNLRIKYKQLLNKRST